MNGLRQLLGYMLRSRPSKMPAETVRLSVMLPKNTIDLSSMEKYRFFIDFPGNQLGGHQKPIGYDRVDCSLFSM